MPVPSHRRPTRAALRPPLPDGPFTISGAADNGWSQSALRHAVAATDLTRLQRGVFALPAPDDPEEHPRTVATRHNLVIAQAATLGCPRAAISHFSAALAWGMPVFGDLDRACVTVQSATALRSLAKVHLHRATLEPADLSNLAGWPVLHPSRTVMDVAREHGVQAGIVAADFALHAQLVNLGELETAFQQCRQWPGRKSARVTLLTADGLAESALESLSRLQMLASGLPRPRLQSAICDGHGRFVARVDFYWPDFGVVGEADGNLKYDRGAQAIVEEKARHKRLEELGLVVVRWGWTDLFPFDKVARRLRTAYARGLPVGSPERYWGVLLPPRLHP
jgi:hypothetical protein